MNLLSERLQYTFEPLSREHKCADFYCGQPSIDAYIQRGTIRQDVGRNMCSAFVMTPNHEDVSGFYTLSGLAIGIPDIPEKHAKRLPSRLPIPVTLIGRMGLHRSLQGKGLGSDLLLDVLHRCWQARETVGSWAVIVDAKEGAREFYLHHEFEELISAPSRLFCTMKQIEKLFQS